MKEKSLDEKIKDFIEYRGNKKFHITGDWSIMPNTSNAYHVPLKVVKGPINRPTCLLCNELIEPIRKDDPKRRARRFCSGACREEYKEIQKIRKKLDAVNIFWPPQKPPIPKHMLRYTMKDSGGEPIAYKARKKRKNQNKTKSF